MSKAIPPLDLTWFLTESASSPKHVGIVLVFELPTGRKGLVGEIVGAYRAAVPMAHRHRVALHGSGELELAGEGLGKAGHGL